MESLPLDMSHPAVRDYLSLVRLQVLTPLSLLINIAAVAVCSVLVNPNIKSITHLHPTALSPSVTVIGLYVLVIYLGQIGYCLLLVFASKPETKRALTKGVGLWLVFANIVMALWVAAWVFQYFLLATILQGLLLLLLLYSNIALLVYHPPNSERPLDTALIHAPLRFFMILPLSILLPLCIFLTLGMSYTPTPPGAPQRYSAWHAWPAFGVILGTNLLGLVVIALRKDIVWCIAATWVCVSVWSWTPKPAPVFITVVIFTALHPLTLIASFIWSRFYRPRRVQLQGEDALYARSSALRPNGARPESNLGYEERHGEAEQQGPREVDIDGTWG